MAIPEELLIDDEEDKQLTHKRKDIEEGDVYKKIKKDMEQMTPEKRKVLRHHVQGIIEANEKAHHVAEHLSGVSKFLSTPGIVALADMTQ